MSKSNGFGPGANERLNGTYIHFTWLAREAELLATA